jgi:hypothetical protein
MNDKYKTSSVVCVGCGISFLAFKAEVNRGMARYCSRKCYHKYRAKSVKERFFKFVSKSKLDGDCWLWNGGTTIFGYGEMGGENRTNLLAHRLSYETFVGPIPDGMYVLHSCDIPSCINPEHLFIGTQKDNIKDMIKKGRGRWDVSRRAKKEIEYGV